MNPQSHRFLGGSHKLRRVALDWSIKCAQGCCSSQLGVLEKVRHQYHKLMLFMWTLTSIKCVHLCCHKLPKPPSTCFFWKKRVLRLNKTQWFSRFGTKSGVVQCRTATSGPHHWFGFLDWPTLGDGDSYKPSTTLVCHCYWMGGRSNVWVAKFGSSVLWSSGKWHEWQRCEEHGLCFETLKRIILSYFVL